MDSLTLAIIAVTLIASQGLLLHVVYNLHSNEQRLRRTLTAQGKEMLKQRKELSVLTERYRNTQVQMDQLREEFSLREKYGAQADSAIETPNMEQIMKYLENGATLDDLISSAGIDEADAYLILNEWETQKNAVN